MGGHLPAAWSGRGACRARGGAYYLRLLCGGLEWRPPTTLQGIQLTTFAPARAPGPCAYRSASPSDPALSSAWLRDGFQSASSLSLTSGCQGATPSLLCEEGVTAKVAMGLPQREFAHPAARRRWALRRSSSRPEECSFHALQNRTRCGTVQLPQDSFECT